jgi:2'-5' RNA ligase
VRLFAAIEFSEATRAAIHGVQQRIASELGPHARALRFVGSEQLHLTLVFVGEVAPARASAVVDALRAPFAQEPFTLALGAASVFPARGAPRVLWLDVIEGAGATIALRRHVNARLGLPSDDSPRAPFTPHVTLARWRRDGPRQRPTGPRLGAAVPPVQVAFVTLFESRLSTTGPAYTALVRTGLGCR